MNSSHYTRGMSIPSLIAIIAVILIGGGLWHANTTKNEDMMEKGDTMMKEGEAMIEGGDKMMKESEAMMSKDITATLSALNASGQTGKATFIHTDGKTKVVVEVSSGAAGVPQPSHIHAA